MATSHPLLHVFARKTKAGGVVITHSDGRHFCYISKDYSLKPDYRHKRITLNCFTYRIWWCKE